MYNSQYYTCEQIDERLLQGYLDDYNSQTGQSLTKVQFLTKLGSLFFKEGTIDNTLTQIGYYECDTAAGTAAKVITVANYSLFAGGSMKVKFVNKNTANNATLNINSQGAKALYYNGVRVSSTNTWDANEVVEIYYDGTSYYANNVKGSSGDGVFDISVYNLTEGQPTKYADLATALGPNGQNVPVQYRKGGMSVKYVQSSDNKYVRYNLIADEFTTDVTKWAIDDVGVYVENPEFFEVYIDAEDKILFGVKTDGNFYFGAGCPQQVKDYVQAQLAMHPLDDIETFLGNLIQGDTLTTLLNGKVDKVEGKSLIDSIFASSQSATENSEWMQVVTDNDNKVLEGISTDAIKIINIDTKINDLIVKNRLRINNSEIETIEDTEWVNVVYDEEKRILEGVKKDGTKWVYNLVVDNPLWLTDFVNNILKEKNNFVERKKAYLQESPVTVLENSENEVLNFASVIKAHTATHFHCHDNLTIEDSNYEALNNAGLGITPDADVEEEGLWYYNKINRNRRKWYKTNQPTLPVSDYKEIDIQTVEDSIYYMYYESIIIQEFRSLEDLAVRLCFAYSTDGVNWVKEFPEGVEAPSFHTEDDDPASNQLLPTGEMHGPSVVRVNDAEYPFRMTAVRMDGPNKYFVCIYKSADGVNWEFIRNITSHDCDSPTSCIVRGNTLKIYCRTRTDDSARLRSIGVIYTDLDGNRYYAPDEINHELVSIAATSKEHQFYQSSASLLDDHRDILFPTIFNETPIGEPYRIPIESVGCIIVDNDNYKEIVFNDAIINTPEFKQIYFATGLINTNDKVYAYYSVKTCDHDHLVDDVRSYIKRVRINIL